jgi:hypothetical protein
MNDIFSVDVFEALATLEDNVYPKSIAKLNNSTL